MLLSADDRWLMCSPTTHRLRSSLCYDDRSVDELKDVVVHAVCSENPEGVDCTQELITVETCVH